MTFLDIPLVHPRELILAVLVLVNVLLQVVLIVQSTADGTTTGQVFADVFPLHAILTELDDLRIFLGRPL